VSEHGLCCVECHASGTAQGENAGASAERERIIKLLEEHLGYGDEEWDSSVIAIIGLIKGEQK